MEANVNQRDMNWKAVRREAAFNSNIVVGKPCHTQIVGLLQKCNLFNNLLYEHSAAGGFVVCDNSGCGGDVCVCEEYQL